MILPDQLWLLQTLENQLGEIFLLMLALQDFILEKVELNKEFAKYMIPHVCLRVNALLPFMKLELLMQLIEEYNNFIKKNYLYLLKIYFI